MLGSASLASLMIPEFDFKPDKRIRRARDIVLPSCDSTRQNSVLCSPRPYINEREKSTRPFARPLGIRRFRL